MDYGDCVAYFVGAHEVFLFSGYYIVFCVARFFCCSICARSLIISFFSSSSVGRQSLYFDANIVLLSSKSVYFTIDSFLDEQRIRPIVGLSLSCFSSFS